MKNIAIIFLFSVSLFILSCAKNEKSTLIVGTSPAFPPFEYINEQGEIVGFDIELAQQIANDYHATLIIKNVDFSNIFTALENGEIDMAISGISITEERKKIVAFSSPYYEASQVILQRKDDRRFKDIRTKELIGQDIVIGVQTKTTCAIVAKEIVGENNVLEFQSSIHAVDELMNKNVDLIILDKEPAKTFITKYNNIIAMPIIFETESYGVAVKNDNANLLESVNTTLARLINSGQYSQFVEEYITSYSVE